MKKSFKIVFVSLLVALTMGKNVFASRLASTDMEFLEKWLGEKPDSGIPNPTKMRDAMERANNPKLRLILKKAFEEMEGESEETKKNASRKEKEDWKKKFDDLKKWYLGE
ncbi:MAG: hypothetical protein LBG48_03120 [Rickettsiales bacterium]|jgi:hypothetical protein|nr:hypothetical protein [Rickettsiales bacterium]